MQAILKNKLLLVTYMLTILYALHYAIPLYATSSFLHQYFNSASVSALYVISSIAILFSSLLISKSIRRFHTYGFTFFLVIAEIIATITFAITDNIFVIGLFFIIHSILQAFLYICINIFIESFSRHTETGSIRGLFLAILSLGYIVSPIIGGAVLAHSSFQMLYIVASLTLVPFLYFLHRYLVHIKEPSYSSVDIFGAIRTVLRNKTLRTIFIADLLVEAFYAAMVIYSPMYLETIGISLTTYMTYILPIALIPLVALPYELGFLADSKHGEKNILISGLLLMAVTTFLCVIVTSSNPLIWAAIFFVSRVGTSLAETMAHTYFFKKVGPEDASLTALFMNLRGIAIILVGSVGFVIAPFLTERPQLMFIVLGCAILWGIAPVLALKERRAQN
jgi:MFS family permease